MRTSSIRTYALPAVLATLAIVLTLVYVSHAGPKPAAAAGTFGVYVATRDIETGASGDDIAHALKLVRVPADTVVPGAVTELGQLDGRVTLAPIYRGEQLTFEALGGLNQQGVAGQLSGTMRAIQVAGDQNQLLAGTLRPGDRVDVVASLKQGATQVPRGRTVLRDVLVLAAPSAPSSSPTSAQTYSATLRLTDTEAQTLFFVTKNGDWSLVLRPAVHASDSGNFVDSIQSVLEQGR